MNIRLQCAFLSLVVAVPVWAGAQTMPSTALLALSKQDHTLAIVDPATLHVLATVPVGDDPHEVIASTDGLTAYVSNYGFGAFHSLAVIDLVNQKRLSSVELGALRGPHGLAFNQGKVWFTAEAAKAIGSYDPSSGQVDWIMGTGQNRTHMLYVFPDSQRILTTNVNSATVTILDKIDARPGTPPPGMPPAGAPPQGPPQPPPGVDWALTVIPVGRGAEGFDVSPSGDEAWVANAQDGTVSVIDLAAKKVIATLAANARGANRLKFTPDGKQVFITAGAALVVMDAATSKEAKRLDTVHGSGGILMQPEGTRAYVACGRDNYVAVIDLKTLEKTGQIPIASPDGLAWAARQQ
jgi:YVTN family beta-propeller protein